MKRFLVDRREVHLSSSRRTWSSAHCAEEESFPIPLRYIDLIRRTRTTLDVLQESRIDDAWNVDGGRELSEPWTDFTQFTMLNEKLPDGHVWSGERLTKIQATTRPDHLWPEIWSGVSIDSSTNSTAGVGYREAEARPCAKVERHLSIDPDCKEFNETIRNARKKLELPMEAAPCLVLVKYHQYRETCGESDNHKSKHAS